MFRVQATYQIETEYDNYMWELKGSYQLNDALYITMDDQNIRNAVAGQRSGSLGGFIALENGIHLYGQAGLADYANDMYPIFEAGVRLETIDDFELRAALRLEPEMPIPGTTDTGEMIIGGEAVYKGLKDFDLLGGIEIFDDLDTTVIRIGARINFN